jgi:energy-coupling factor transporter transmembrane protein EcfT
MKNFNISSLLVLFILFLILGGCIFLLITKGDLLPLISFFFSPYSFLLLFVMLVEYLFLKGIDRSHVFKLENQKLKQKRSRDIAFRKWLENRIDDISDKVDNPGEIKTVKKHLQDIKNNLKDV